MPVSDKSQVVGGGGFEQDVVEAGFQVQHANSLRLSQLGTVPPCIVELILILGRPFINRDDVLTYSVGLPRLDARD